MITERMKKLGFISNPKFIILFYLGFCILIFAGSTVEKRFDRNLTLVRLGFLAVYTLMTVLVFKGKKAALWVIAVFIFINGLGMVVISTVFIGIDQWLLKTSGIVIGAYFVYSGYVLPRKGSEAFKKHE